MLTQGDEDALAHAQLLAASGWDLSPVLETTAATAPPKLCGWSSGPLSLSLSTVTEAGNGTLLLDDL